MEECVSINNPTDGVVYADLVKHWTFSLLEGTQFNQFVFKPLYVRNG